MLSSKPRWPRVSCAIRTTTTATRKALAISRQRRKMAAVGRRRAPFWIRRGGAPEMRLGLPLISAIARPTQVRKLHGCESGGGRVLCPYYCFAPALREDPGGCGSADHPKLPLRPRLNRVQNRLFGFGFAGLGAWKPLPRALRAAKAAPPPSLSLEIAQSAARDSLLQRRVTCELNGPSHASIQCTSSKTISSGCWLARLSSRRSRASKVFSFFCSGESCATPWAASGSDKRSANSARSSSACSLASRSSASFSALRSRIVAGQSRRRVRADR